MRNLFDQYSQPENRLTHALVSCLNEDKRLLKSFLSKFVKGTIPPVKILAVTEQGLPDTVVNTEEEAERKGLPDGLIHNGEDWALIIESKVSSSHTTDQLRRHENTIRRYGFTEITGLAIGTEGYKRRRSVWKPVTWTEIYQWGRREAKTSEWAKHLVEYFDVAEAKMVADGYLTEGSITEFTGIPFSKEFPYSYPEAKRVLRLLMQLLRRNKELKVKLKLNTERPGRGAITSHGSVWDLIPLDLLKADEAFTKYPHFTVNIRSEDARGTMALPNRVDGSIRRRFIDLGFEGFSKIAKEIATNSDNYFRKEPGATPFIQVLQRRYPSQSSKPIVDSVLEFDIRTAFEDMNGLQRQSIKTQGQWLESSYEALREKRSNLELCVGVKFDYEKCQLIHSAKAEKLFVNSWLACKPLLDAIMK